MFQRLLNAVGLGRQHQHQQDRRPLQGSCEDLDRHSSSSDEIANQNAFSPGAESEFWDCEEANDCGNEFIKRTEQPIKRSTIGLLVDKPNVPSRPAVIYVTTVSLETEIVSGVTVNSVMGNEGTRTVKIFLPAELLPVPHQGDKLIVRYQDDGRRHNLSDLLIPDSVDYIRRRDDELVRVTGRGETLNGNQFVYFEKGACCDLSAMPVDAPCEVGALYKLSMVESKQPRHHIWRAHSMEYQGGSPVNRITPDETKITVVPLVELGKIPFGSIGSGVITICNVDPERRRTLLRVSITGLPLQLIGPVSLSEPHQTDQPTTIFHRSVDYFPHKEIKPLSLSSFEEAHVTVRVVGMCSGVLRFAVHFHFHGWLTRTCVVNANILDISGKEDLTVREEVALPRPDCRNLGRSLCKGDATERLKEIVNSQRVMGLVRAPKLCSPEEDKLSGWTSQFREQYRIPDLMMDVLNDSTLTREVLTEKYPILLQSINLENYAEKFHTLMYMEEHSELVSVRSYDLVSDGMSLIDKGKDTYRLKLENLQEQRPSLVRGDTAAVRSVADRDGSRYQGRIVKVGLDYVDMTFDSKFTEHYFKPALMLDFAFFPNRNCYRRIHNVMNMAKRNLSSRLFFPDLKNRDRCIKRISQALAGTEQLEFVNKNLNESQQQAVKMVVVGRCQPMAHVIFGPPGTGKTVTVVEITLQVFTRNPKSRILVSGPSNSAIDFIGQKLIDSGRVPTDSLRRILSVQRTHDKVPVQLADSVQTGCVNQLPEQQRIVLTTCLCASFLVDQTQNFTHVIVDEAGFATEPEILIPLAAVAGRPDVQVVLAGDPQQLGPVVFSAYSKEFGLEKSLLSRLLELPAYGEWTDEHGNTHPYCPYLVSKLDINYRTVDSLLKVPSKFFYNGELKSNIGDDQNVYAPRLGLPALSFWPVKALETRESRSPSIANPGQVNVVCQLMQNLLTVGITADNIGIITPYRLQAEHIRKALLGCQLTVPKIGTVEEFQGQEKDAVIFSTVRAREFFHAQTSVKDLLGFVACPKRTNVALTRARFIFMLIGDPAVLAMDKHWNGILRYCCVEDLYQTDLYNKHDYPPPPLLSVTDVAANTDQNEQLVPEERECEFAEVIL
ncbi:putative helicase Mov10l1 [Hypsibius exemplaris]|uniref:RNA helicase n=1 Tax=Hypsibius exemplaris TaxID=2072580 RepID=A0A1W0WD39_HYPEX|nr:putative helicase Mov10l1 [Hypsibius exemplaris]